VDLEAHASLRPLTDVTALVTKLATVVKPAVEFFKIDVEQDVAVDGWMLKPASFDPGRKYPVIVFVYGEPASQTVTDRWGSRNTLFHRGLAEAGYIVVSFDNRGTPAPRGAVWRKMIYGAVGELSSKDQAAAIRALAARHSFIDAQRVGIWGWSGGGSSTLNAMFRFPDVFRCRSRGGASARSTSLRHDLSGTLYGRAAGQRRRLSSWIADQFRRRACAAGC
jgi:dipeptidyl-peptidase-4